MYINFFFLVSWAEEGIPKLNPEDNKLGDRQQCTEKVSYKLLLDGLIFFNADNAIRKKCKTRREGRDMIQKYVETSTPLLALAPDAKSHVAAKQFTVQLLIVHKGRGMHFY